MVARLTTGINKLVSNQVLNSLVELLLFQKSCYLFVLLFHWESGWFPEVYVFLPPVKVKNMLNSWRKFTTFTKYNVHLWFLNTKQEIVPGFLFSVQLHVLVQLLSPVRALFVTHIHSVFLFRAKKLTELDKKASFTAHYCVSDIAQHAFIRVRT